LEQGTLIFFGKIKVAKSRTTCLQNSFEQGCKQAIMFGLGLQAEPLVCKSYSNELANKQTESLICKSHSNEIANKPFDLK